MPAQWNKIDSCLTFNTVRRMVPVNSKAMFMDISICNNKCKLPKVAQVGRVGQVGQVGHLVVLEVKVDQEG